LADVELLPAQEDYRRRHPDRKHGSMKTKSLLTILLCFACGLSVGEAQNPTPERTPDVSVKTPITTDAPAGERSAPKSNAADDNDRKIMSEEVRLFFESYLTGWDRADAERLADHYTIPAAIYGSSGPEAFPTRSLLAEKLKLYCAHFSSMGYAGASFSCRHYTPLGESSAFVDLHWTIQRKGAAPYIFGTAYILQKSNSEWRIFSAIPYQLRGD
jgi:hypothetical protein